MEKEEEKEEEEEEEEKEEPSINPRRGVWSENAKSAHVSRIRDVFIVACIPRESIND
jgi:hypothetical protein